MRLIDADALLERIMDINSWYLYNEWGSETEFHKLIDEAPTVEPTDTDLISRADAITEFREWVKRANENGETPTWNDAVSLIGSLPSAEQVISKLNNPCDSLLTDESNGSKEQKSKLDLISRADAIKAVAKLQKYDLDERNRLRIYAPWHKPKRIFVETEAVYKCIYTMPSADADGEDLIIKGAKGIQDGLYNIKDGKLFKYKANGGTVRTYPIVPSADAIHSVGVFVPNMEMPKVCDYCLFHDSEWSWCKAKDKYCGDGKCPLIAVRGERND